MKISFIKRGKSWCFLFPYSCKKSHHRDSIGVLVRVHHDKSRIEKAIQRGWKGLSGIFIVVKEKHTHANLKKKKKIHFPLFLEAEPLATKLISWEWEDKLRKFYFTFLLTM